MYQLHKYEKTYKKNIKFNSIKKSYIIIKKKEKNKI